MAVGRINGVAVLKKGFSDKELYGRCAGTKLSGRNNKAAVLTG